MDEKPLSIGQVFVVTNIEIILQDFDMDPVNRFNKMLELIDEHKISEHKETMQYLHGLLVMKKHDAYAAEFAKKYSSSFEENKTA
jgi:hypothetical protein